MHDTCTVFCRHIIPGDHLERSLARIKPRNELLISYTCELGALESTLKHLERYELVSGLIVFE